MRKLMKNLLAAGALLAGAWGMNAGPANAAELGATNDPINIALYEWTGQHVTAHIYGHILESMGYKVKFTTAGYLSSGQAVADGDITLAPEIWDNNLGKFWPDLLKSGKVANIGAVGLDAGEGWLYPAFMKDKCPGLPAWDAFKKCAQVFATPETYPKGRLLAYPADWGHRSADLIKGENLPYTAVPAGSEGALAAELQSAEQAKTPLVMMFWKPHWLLSKYKVGWVDMPKSIVDKYSFQPPKVFNGAWPGFAKKWPAAYEFLKSFKISNAIQEPLMDAIDNKGGDVVALTQKWVADHKSEWQPLVDKAKM